MDRGDYEELLEGLEVERAHLEARLAQVRGAIAVLEEKRERLRIDEFQEPMDCDA